jgi:hypothetical protein
MEVQSLALFAGMSGGLMMTSDNLAELSPSRIRSLAEASFHGKTILPFPLLGRQPIAYGASTSGRGGGAAATADPVVVQVRDSDRGHIVNILNMSTSQVERTFSTSVLGIEGVWHVYDWVTDRAWEGMVDVLPVMLGSHENVLLYLSKTPLSIIAGFSRLVGLILQYNSLFNT